jgi:hypothetical protein
MILPDVDQELERLFEATRQSTQPPNDARARIAAALAAQLALGAADKVAPAPRALGAKLWLLSALGFVVALGIGAALWRSTAPTKPVAALAASALPLASPSAVSVLPSAVSAVPSAAPLPLARVAVEGSPSARARAAPLRAPAVVVEPPAEPEIIGRMQLALRSGDAPAALVVASEHARYFPNGALTEERESGRAIARCWLAKPEARDALLTAFLRHYESSPYAARVKAACRP